MHPHARATRQTLLLFLASILAACSSNGSTTTGTVTSTGVTGSASTTSGHAATTAASSTTSGSAVASSSSGAVTTASASSTTSGSAVASSSSGAGTTASASSTTSGGAGTTSSGTSSSGGSWDGGTRFPASSILYQNIADAGLDPNSGAIIGALSDAGGWGTPSPNKGKFQIDFGLTTLYADATVPRLPFTQNVGSYESPDCDATPVPLPPGGAAEATADYNCDTGEGDCHILVYQGHWLFELWHGNTPSGLWDGGLSADCEVAWDLTHDYWQPGVTPYSRGDQCTSADAAGMPIAATLVTDAELQAGVIPHALRFTLPPDRFQPAAYLHPGTHSAGGIGAAPLPLYAARFRLKPTFNVAGLPNAAAQAIAVALQTYGMFFDDGGNIPLTIDASAANDLGSHDLFGIEVSDFEVVAAPDAPVSLTDTCTRTQLTSTE